MKINPQTKITMLDPDFVQAINSILQTESKADGHGIVINYYSPKYSATRGGFHPVELALNAEGNLMYLTDFSYMGAELEKELDWDFTHERFQQFGHEHDLICGRGLFQLYQRNFTAYYRSGVYEVEVTEL